MKRVAYLDILCGVMIMNIILAHICAYLRLFDILDHLFFFCLPWFFFKGGMFFHFSSNWRKRLVNDSRRLLIPFLFFGLIGLFYAVILHLFAEGPEVQGLWSHVKTLSLYGTFPNSYHLWFLFTLFLVRTVADRIWEKVNTWLVILVCVALTSLSFFTRHSYPLYAFNGLDALFFFVLGGVLRDIQYKPKVVATSAVVLLIILCFCPTKLDMMMNNVLYGFYPLWYPFSLAGVICVNTAGKWLYSHVILPHALQSVTGTFMYVGKRSMLFYVAQGIIIKLGIALCAFTGIGNPYVSLVVVTFFSIIAFSLLILLFRWLTWLRLFIGEQ